MFRFIPRTIPSHIIVVGCGGTGSRLVPLLAQFVASITKDKNPRGWLDNPTILLIDDDVVEAKNLLRQNFVSADVGKPKAAVLAQRYGRAYGVNILPSLKRIDGTTPFDKDEPVRINFSQSMVIMCVDSAQARRDIIRAVNYTPKITGQGAFFIDAGNEDNFGQVRFFNQAFTLMTAGLPHDPLPKLSPVVLDTEAIPIDLKYYEELQDMPGQGSCADLDQTLAINAMMATLIMGIVQNYYFVKPMTYNQISISLDGGVSTSYNTPAEFMRRASALNAYGESHGIQNVKFDRFRGFDLSPMLREYTAETKKVMKAMEVAAKTVVAETAVETTAEAAPAEKPKRKRSKKAEVAGVQPEALPPDTRPVDALADAFVAAAETGPTL